MESGKGSSLPDRLYKASELKSAKVANIEQMLAHRTEVGDTEDCPVAEPNKTQAFIALRDLFIALRKGDMRVIQKCQYADNETPKLTEGKPKSGQTLEIH